MKGSQQRIGLQKKGGEGIHQHVLAKELRMGKHTHLALQKCLEPIKSAPTFRTAISGIRHTPRVVARSG